MKPYHVLELGGWSLTEPYPVQELETGGTV